MKSFERIFLDAVGMPGPVGTKTGKRKRKQHQKFGKIYNSLKDLCFVKLHLEDCQTRSILCSVVSKVCTIFGI